MNVYGRRCGMADNMHKKISTGGGSWCGERGMVARAFIHGENVRALRTRDVPTIILPDLPPLLLTSLTPDHDVDAPATTITVTSTLHPNLHTPSFCNPSPKFQDPTRRVRPKRAICLARRLETQSRRALRRLTCLRTKMLKCRIRMERSTASTNLA
jgi:hypothetical protein